MLLCPFLLLLGHGSSVRRTQSEVEDFIITVSSLHSGVPSAISIATVCGMLMMVSSMAKRLSDDFKKTHKVWLLLKGFLGHQLLLLPCEWMTSL